MVKHDWEESRIMPSLTLDISMSLDGFIADLNRTPEQPLGNGGDRLHE
jgi:hypothetical protein